MIAKRVLKPRSDEANYYNESVEIRTARSSPTLFINVLVPPQLLTSRFSDIEIGFSANFATYVYAKNFQSFEARENPYLLGATLDATSMVHIYNIIEQITSGVSYLHNREEFVPPRLAPENGFTVSTEFR